MKRFQDETVLAFILEFIFPVESTQQRNVAHDEVPQQWNRQPVPTYEGVTRLFPTSAVDSLWLQHLSVLALFPLANVMLVDEEKKSLS